MVFTEGIRKCEECIKKVLSGPKCFENVNMYVVADKMAKFDFTKKKDAQIINKKAMVLNKFKNYAAE